MSPFFESIVKRVRWRMHEAALCSERVRDRTGDSVAFSAWNRDCAWRRMLFRHDAITGWRFIPNLKARIPHESGFYTVRTNREGLRAGSDFDRKPTPGTFRVLMLGDSYTAGDGVSNECRFSEQLERRYPHLEIMNAGLSGTGTDQQLLLFETYLKDYEVDAYVFCILEENILRLKQACWPGLSWRTGEVLYRARPYFTQKGGALTQHNIPVPKGFRRAEDLGEWAYSYDKDVEREGRGDSVYADQTSELWILMRALIKRFLRRVAPSKPVFIVPLPTRTYIQGKRAPAYMDRFLEFHDPDRHVFVPNVLGAFHELTQRERECCTFANDMHYSPSGHAVVARSFGSALELWTPEWFADVKRGPRS